MSNIIFTVVASGFTVGSDVDLRTKQLRAIFAPALNNADLGIQGCIDGTSAGYVRMLETRVASGDLKFGVGSGARVVPFLMDTMVTPPYIKLETIMAIGSAQTDNRTFTLLTRPRL